MNTTWIWPDVASGGVKGARVDLETGNIEWVDQPGCACHDAFRLQSIDNFLNAGPIETLRRMSLKRCKRSLPATGRIRERNPLPTMALTLVQ